MKRRGKLSRRFFGEIRDMALMDFSGNRVNIYWKINGNIKTIEEKKWNKNRNNMKFYIDKWK